jgi:hypothetical protein
MSTNDWPSREMGSPPCEGTGITAPIIQACAIGAWAIEKCSGSLSLLIQVQQVSACCDATIFLLFVIFKDEARKRHKTHT